MPAYTPSLDTSIDQISSGNNAKNTVLVTVLEEAFTIPMFQVTGFAFQLHSARVDLSAILRLDRKLLITTMPQSPLGVLQQL